MEDAEYHHIVVAIDGSRASRAALEHAAELARVSRACLDVLVVANVPSTIYWGGAIAEPAEQLDHCYAELARRAVASIPDIPVTSYVVKGSPARAIVRHAAEHCCDLIVLGSRGRMRPLGVLRGSTSFAVMRRARVPVIVVRPSDGALHDPPVVGAVA